MNAAIILATDRGERLRPLTSDEMPTPLLPLGDRRSLAERALDDLSLTGLFDRLILVIPEGANEAVWSFRDASSPQCRTLRGSDREGLLAEISEAGSVLIQPATQRIGDPASYREALRGALAQAVETGAVVGVDAERGRQTRIQAWPGGLLASRLECERLHQIVGTAPQEAVSFDDPAWVDVQDWDDVRTVLAYVEKPWGYERLWALTPLYAGKILFIKAGESLSLQYHELKDETIRIESGQMRFRAGPSPDHLETYILDPGMSFAIPTGLVHQMEAIEDCTVVEVSTPHLADVVRIEDRYGRA